MYRTLFGILSAFLAALLVAGLTFSTTREAPPDFRFINGTEPKSLDPQLTTGAPESRLTEALFEGLTRFDSKTMGPVPGVAKSWDLSEDGTVYTFHLRENARWSDGTKLTAEDFVRSWKRLLAPATAAEYAYMLFPIRHAEALSVADGRAEAIDKKILPALETLRGRSAGGIEAAAWQRFLAENHVNDPLRTAEAPRLVELLARTGARVSQAELGEFAALARAASAELREAAAEARRRFGTDAGAVAVDAHTLRVELRAPTPYFVELMAHHSAFPVPRAVAEAKKAPDDWFLPGKLVSNGPFRLARWVVNDHLRLARSETYWGKDEVRLQTIDVLPNDNWTTCVNLYLTGAADWLPRYYPAELAPILRKRKDFISEPGLSVYFLRLNVTKGPLGDRRVRKALALAIDRELIVREVRSLGEVAATTLVPPGLRGYQAPETELRFDVAEAKRLLAEAGYPNGKGFPRFGLLFNTSEDHKRIADVVSDQWRRNLGLDINPYNQEWQSYLDTTHSLDYEIARAGWIGDYLDPNTFLDMWVTNGDNNYTGFSSPLYDRLIRLAADVTPLLENAEALLAVAKEPEALKAAVARARSGSGAERLLAKNQLRMLVFREAEAILVQDEFPIVPLFFYVDGHLLRGHVRGMNMRVTLADGSVGLNLQDRHPLRDMWVENRVEGPP